MKVCIYNGKIVTPNEVIKGNLYIENGKIKKIEGGESNREEGYLEIDAKGNWIMPGIIDCHSDAVELDLQPRPTSIFGIDIAFNELEKKLISSGITTIYHSLSIAKNMFNEDKAPKYYRTPKGVEELSNWIYKNREQALINHKLHIRYEIDNVGGGEQVKRLMSENKIDELSIMDHTPGQGQFRNLEKYTKVVAAYRDCSEDEAKEYIKESMEREKMSAQEIGEMIECAQKNGIPVASHDDDEATKIDLLKEWKVQISEFPITLDVAKYAKEQGMYTVMGAPNILLGGSHSGNLSAEVAINHDAVDILCSDYYPSSILHSIFYMYKKGKAIEDMVRLASLNPAKALNIADKTGSIEEGKMADILIVEEKNNLPMIKNVFSSGRMVMSIGG